MIAFSDPILLVQANSVSAASIDAHLPDLAGSRATLECSETVDQALQFLEQHSVSAILLDLDLPDVQELDAFIMLHLRVPETPILVFAETVSVERGLAAVRAGAQDCMTRAEVESPHLGRALGYAIERQAIQQESHSHAEQLQFSEARFRLLTNENADAIVLVSPQGVIRFANPAAAALLGKPREALVGDLLSVSLEDDGKTIPLERGRETILVHVRVAETFWSREHALLATLRDVTEQQRIADALRDSKERYQEFIAASLDGIWRTDFQEPLSLDLPEQVLIDAMFHETFIAECNDAMAQMYGYERGAEMLGRGTAEDVAPADPVNRELFKAFIHNNFRLQGGISHETDRYGNPRIFRNNMYGIVRDNFLVGMWGTQQDVTAQKFALDELKRAAAEEGRQRQLAQALADTAAALNSTLSFEQVIDRILENVGHVVPHDAVSIFLLQEGVAHLVRGRGFEERQLQEWMEGLQLPVEEIPGMAHMIQSGKPLLIPSTRLEPGWVDLSGGWIQSYLGAPLRVHGETLGFLNLDSATENFFNEDSAEDLQAFADHAATALENARLHAEMERRANESAALYDLTRELVMQRDLETLLATLLERAMKLLDASGGGISLYLSETRELETRVTKGKIIVPVGGKLKVGEGMVGRVAITREPLIVDDYRTWEHRVGDQSDSDVSAALSVPMLFGGELIGVLSVREWGNTRRHYTESDARRLMWVATQAAVLVHNARLLDETEKRAQQMGLLYDAGLTLNGVLEPRKQLDFLTRIAMRSVHAERAAFFRFDALTRTLGVEISLGAHNGRESVYVQQVPLDSPRGIEAWVARERIPVTLRDAAADPRFLVTEDDIGSGVWVPVEHDGRLLGVLAVAAEARNAFSPHDERLLILFASQAAVALENARLYSNAVEANQRRTVLHWASQEIISAGLDAERVYAAIHQAASRLMPCEAFVIAVMDEGGEGVELAYLYDPGGRHPSSKILKMRGLTGYMLERGEALVVDDLAASGLDVINFGHPKQVVSVLAVPLRHGGRVFGMLSAQSYQAGAYDNEDREILEMLAAHAAAALMNVRGAQAMLDSQERAYLETALALAKTIDARDSYTGLHSDRIAQLAEAVARAMGLDQEEAQMVRLGARLHDIGKIGVPDDVLRKPTALSPREWTLMRRHPEIGAEILALVRPLHSVIPIVRHHQERFDGSGYPDGFAGDAIPLGARILAVVDAFSAITDDRVYRKGRSAEEALDELRECAGTQFDPQVVEAFERVWKGEG